MHIRIEKVFLLNFFIIPSQDSMRASRFMYSIYRGPINLNWPCKSHPNKLNLTFSSKPISIKVIIQVCHPVIKNLRVKDTVKCERIYFNPTDYAIFTSLCLLVFSSLLSQVSSLEPSSLFLFSNPSTLSFKSRSSLRIRSNLSSILKRSEWFVLPLRRSMHYLKWKYSTHNHTNANSFLCVSKCVHYMNKWKFSY